MSRTRVVVTGLGCINPLGNDLSTSWEALLEGRSGAAPVTLFEASQLKTQFAAEVKDFNAVEYLGRRLARRTDRFTQFAVVATQEALNQAGIDPSEQDYDRIGVIVGTGIGGVGILVEETIKFTQRGPKWVSPFLVPMMLPDSSAGQIAITFGFRGPNMAVATACASSANAIGEATETIRRGAADVMVASGAEAVIVSMTMAGFNNLGAISTNNEDPAGASRPFDLNRDGFVVAEGAASLVLESYQHARSRGAPILAEITGYGTTNDAYHISAPSENGTGAANCMKIAIRDAALQLDQIDYINAHGTSTHLNDSSETTAIKTVFGDLAYDIPISSTKSSTGHLLGAAGALEAVFCVMAMQQGIIPATINYSTPDPECDLDYVPNQTRPAKLRHILSNSFGFGGHNACLIFSQPSENEAEA